MVERGPRDGSLERLVHELEELARGVAHARTRGTLHRTRAGGGRTRARSARVPGDPGLAEIWCVDRGRRRPRRRCRHCDRERPVRNRDGDPGRAYLSPSGPHRCDLCGEVVATLEALRTDCPAHGPEREDPAEDRRPVEAPSDLGVLGADVRGTGRRTARRTVPDAVEFRIAGARALLRAARRETDSDGARDAIGSALEWTAPSKLSGGPDA